MRNKHTYFFYDLKKFRDDRKAEVNCLGRKDEMSKRKCRGGLDLEAVVWSLKV